MYWVGADGENGLGATQGARHVAPRVLLLAASADIAVDEVAAALHGDFVVLRSTTPDRVARATLADVIVVVLSASPGTTFIRELRRSDPRVPLFVLTPSSDEETMEELLEAGADECLALPVRPRLLQVRLRVLPRRTAVFVNPVTFSDVSIDTATRTLLGPAARANLSQREFAILTYLMARREAVIARSELLLRVWGYDFDPGTSVLDVTIARVRRKIGQGWRQRAVSGDPRGRLPADVIGRSPPGRRPVRKL